MVATSENGPEAVFVVERLPGTSEQCEYEIIRLQEVNAAKTLMGAEGEGYRIVRLLGDLVLLERPQNKADSGSYLLAWVSNALVEQLTIGAGRNDSNSSRPRRRRGCRPRRHRSLFGGAVGIAGCLGVQTSGVTCSDLPFKH